MLIFAKTLRWNKKNCSKSRLIEIQS